MIKPAKVLIEQIVSLSRMYPNVITAHELIGQTYCLLKPDRSVDTAASLLAHLSKREISKYTTAVKELLGKYNDFNGVDGFRHGAIVSDVRGGPARIVVDERMVPGEFVIGLRHTLDEFDRK